MLIERDFLLPEPTTGIASVDAYLLDLRRAIGEILRDLNEANSLSIDKAEVNDSPIGSKIASTGAFTTITGAFGGTFSDAEIAALAALTSAADKFPYFTGSGAAALADLSSAMRTFLTTSSSANLRALLTDESGTGAALFQSGDLGTPSAGVLTNATGLPVSTGISGLGANVATLLATFSSANLGAALTDEVGSGKVFLGVDTTSYNPTWGSVSNPQPAIGNGSIVGSYCRIGNLVFATITLNFGSTTTYGTGEWTVSLPLTASGYSFTGACQGLVSGVQFVAGSALLLANGSTLKCYNDGNTATAFSATQPASWVNGSQLNISIVYLV